MVWIAEVSEVKLKKPLDKRRKSARVSGREDQNVGDEKSDGSG